MLADLFNCPAENIRVAYNGVDADALLGLSPEGRALVDRLGLLDSDLVLLMPVRVTQAKNIEYALGVTAALKERDCRPRLIVTGPPDPHDGKIIVYFRSLRTLRTELNVEHEARFVFESGPYPNEPRLVDDRVVGDLYRMSDVMFMPSHREGFGMPVVEAGLAGVPVVCADVPAASEIGGSEVMLIDPAVEPIRTADRILELIEHNPISRLRRRVRQGYSWSAIFRRDIEPLLKDTQTK
jgi:glycosyltransferase involved in cell wall biosynthesis